MRLMLDILLRKAMIESSKATAPLKKSGREDKPVISWGVLDLHAI